MKIRSATAKDLPYAIELIYSAGPELYDFLYRTDRHLAQDFIAYEFASGVGFCGHAQVTVVEQDDMVVATGCFFDGRQFDQLSKQTALNMLRFYGLSVAPVLLRARHIGSVMKRPQHQELYLSNFGVAAAYRSQGIGSALLHQQIAYAKTQQYRSFGLDVADTNPRAQALYERHGLLLQEEKVFSGRRRGICVPNARKMLLAL